MPDNDWIMPLFNLILTDTTHGNKDILNLYKILPDMETFVKVLKLFNGRKVKFPTEKEINDSMVLALVYYYRYEKGLAWDEVRELVPYEFNPVGYSAKIAGFNVQLKKKIKRLLELDDGQS